MEIYSLIVLEVKSPKARCQQGCGPSEVFKIYPSFLWWLAAIFAVSCFWQPNFNLCFYHYMSFCVYVPMSKFPSSFFLKILFTYFQREEGREKEKVRNINVWLPFKCPLPGTWPTTHACALSGNRNSDPLICRSALDPLSHTCQGQISLFLKGYQSYWIQGPP